MGRLAVQQMKGDFFSLLLDEKSKGSRSFVAFLARYLDREQEKIATCCFGVDELSNQTAISIKKLVTQRFETDGVPRSNLLSVMCDSCNTMRGERGGFIKLLQQEHELDHIIDLDGCSLHHVHNATKYAVGCMGYELELFLKDLYNYFRYAKRRVGLSEIQDSLGVNEETFIRPVETRWLQTFDVVNRVLNLWSTLTKFCSSQSTVEDDVENRSRLKRIKNMVSRKDTLLRLYFVVDALSECKKFEMLFQKDNPLIHKLHNKMTVLVNDILVRFVSTEALDDVDLSNVEFDKPENHLPRNLILVGSRCDDILKGGDICSVSSEERDAFYKDVVNFYVTLVQKLLLYFPIGNSGQGDFLHSLSFLHCDSHDLLKFEENVMHSAKKMPTVISVGDQSNLAEEARRFKLDEKVAAIDQPNLVNFWLKVEALSSYPLLSKLALAALCLHHGNAESERVLKLLSHNLSKERSLLGEVTVNALMVTKTGFNARGWTSSTFPISQSLREISFNARHAYQLRIEAQRRKKEEAAKRKMQKQLEKEAEQKLKALKGNVLQKEAELCEIKKKAEHKRKEALELLRSAENDEKQIARHQKALKRKQEKISQNEVSKCVKRLMNFARTDDDL